MTVTELDKVYAMTDITCFDLIGYLHELCRSAGLSAALWKAVDPAVALSDCAG